MNPYYSCLVVLTFPALATFPGLPLTQFIPPPTSPGRLWAVRHSAVDRATMGPISNLLFVIIASDLSALVAFPAA